MPRLIWVFVLSVDSEDSDQVGQKPRLIWVFGGRLSHFVSLVMLRFKDWFLLMLDKLPWPWPYMTLTYLTWLTSSTSSASIWSMGRSVCVSYVSFTCWAPRALFWPLALYKPPSSVNISKYSKVLRIIRSIILTFGSVQTPFICKCKKMI